LPPGWTCPPLGTTAYPVTPFPITNAAMTAFGAPSGTLALSAGKDALGNAVLPYFSVANNPASAPAGPPQVLTTGASTCPGGCDPSLRPVAPAMFCTDITAKNTNKGDWQIVGNTGIAPDFVSGSWKSASSTVACTDNGTTTTCTPSTTVGTDPQENVPVVTAPVTWYAGPNAEAPIGGYNTLTTPISALKAENFGAEVRWNVNNQTFHCINGVTGLPNANAGFEAGHVYRIQILIHDGDQNKTGGDAGQACSTIAIPPVLPPNFP